MADAVSIPKQQVVGYSRTEADEWPVLVGAVENQTGLSKSGQIHQAQALWASATAWFVGVGTHGRKVMPIIDREVRMMLRRMGGTWWTEKVWPYNGRRSSG